MSDVLATAQEPTIEAEKTKLKSVIKNVKEGIIVADQNQKVTIINDAAGRITAGNGFCDCCCDFAVMAFIASPPSPGELTQRTSRAAPERTGPAPA